MPCSCRDRRAIQLFTLKGADEPYRVLIEEMNQGAVTLSADGSILYCNRRFADLLKRRRRKSSATLSKCSSRLRRRAAFAALLEAVIPAERRGNHPPCRRRERGAAATGAGSAPAESAAAICLIATDISESREKEARLRKTMEETIIAERALEESNQHLLQKNQEIQNFYHTVGTS